MLYMFKFLINKHLFGINSCLCLTYIFLIFKNVIVEVITRGENVFRGFAVQSRTSTDAFDTNAAFQGGFDNIDGDSLWQLIACPEVCIIIMCMVYQ